MVDPEILAYYGHGLEQDRLRAGDRRIEFLRLWDLLSRHLPPAPARVLDIGGGAGVYALPLAAAGYEVHLVDPVPLHVEQASAASRAAAQPLASVTLGDARRLDAATAGLDAALLLGPLYHLTSRDDRIAALREAARVVRPGGIVVAKALSRFYPLFEDLAHGTPVDLDRTAALVGDGQYRNPDGDPAQFTTAFLHRPQDLTAEVEAAGLRLRTLVAGTGVVRLLPGFAARLDDPDQREIILAALRLVEAEPSVLGTSQNFLAIAERPGADD